MHQKKFIISTSGKPYPYSGFILVYHGFVSLKYLTSSIWKAFFSYIYKTVQLVHAYCGFMDKIEVKYQLGRKNRASCLEKEHFVLISVTHHCTLSSVITCCILKWKATKEKICKRYPHFVKTSFSYFMIFTPDTQGISWLRGLEKLIGSPPSSVHNWSLSDRDQDAKRGKERWLEPFSC